MGGFLPVRFRASMLQKRTFDIWRDLAECGMVAFGLQARKADVHRV